MRGLWPEASFGIQGNHQEPRGEGYLAQEGVGEIPGIPDVQVGVFFCACFAFRGGKN